MKKQSLFDMISGVYGLFYDSQRSHYKKIIASIKTQLNFNAFENVIDIGCGTGAFCCALSEFGLQVTGIDASEKMLKVAREKTKATSPSDVNGGCKPITFINASILEKLPFEDEVFDVSIASYVAHGLKPIERQIMYKEMKRVTKRVLIIYDYDQQRSLGTDVIEWLEGGDYFNFIRGVKEELREAFGEIMVIKLPGKAAMYVHFIKAEE
ncbi:class I SAM-dependent methyltransferase [Fusibacter bizertensis]